ncbi:hypothetical protein CB1_000917013 [Camelus ferus]|nr:hypothetical protein CB1_000917013 [Camelus ferus]
MFASIRLGFAVKKQPRLGLNSQAGQRGVHTKLEQPSIYLTSVRIRAIQLADQTRDVQSWVILISAVKVGNLEADCTGTTVLMKMWGEGAGSEFRDQWRRVMLEMNLTLMAILKLTPAEPPPGVACLRTTVPLTFGYVLLPPGAAGAVLALRSCEDLK